MDVPQSKLYTDSVYLAFASTVAILFSIAASQALLGLALAALFLSGARLRLPKIWLPVALFLLGTVISLAFSPDPAAGFPQIRKIFVYTMLLVVFSTMRSVTIARNLFLCWAGAGALVAMRGLVQFYQKWLLAKDLHRNFYDFYVQERIRGFMSHWMTFSGQEMFVFLMLLAYLLFAADARRRWLWLWVLCAGLLATALLLADTRSIWLATGAGVLFLLWCSKRALVLIVPLVVVAGIWLGPEAIRTRAISIVRPQKNVDSNEHRKICWRTGWNMIQAHPLLGVGPEEIKKPEVFFAYLPADVHQPLPPGWYGHLHSIYVHYAAERGVPTMLMMLWMLLQAIYDFARALGRLGRGRSDERFLLLGGIACVLGTMVSGIFELNLGDSEVLTMFLAIVACGYVAVESAEAIETVARAA